MHAVLSLSAVLAVVVDVAVDEAFVEAAVMDVDSLGVEAVTVLVMVLDMAMTIRNVELLAIQPLKVDQVLFVVDWIKALLLWWIVAVVVEDAVLPLLVDMGVEAMVLLVEASVPTTAMFLQRVVLAATLVDVTTMPLMKRKKTMWKTAVISTSRKVLSSARKRSMNPCLRTSLLSTNPKTMLKRKFSMVTATIEYRE